MATFTNIGNQIKTILQTITTANVVYGYMEPNPAGYPAIMIEAHDGNAEFIDTGRNRRSFIFRITCMQERVNVGPEQAEIILRAMMDEIIATFDNRNNLTLNNSVIYALPIPSTWGYIQAPDIDVRTAQILIEAQDVS